VRLRRRSNTDTSPFAGAERAATGSRSAPQHSVPSSAVPPAESQVGGAGATADRPDPIKAIPIRRWGRWISAAVVFVLFGLLVASFARNPNLKWALVGDYLFSPLVLRGVLVTLLLTFLAMLLGIVGGVIVAVMRQSTNYVLRGVSSFYIWFFRGTPVYVQIFFWGFIAILFKRLSVGIPFTDYVLWSVDTNKVIPVFVAGVLALGLNEAAYAAELVRAGILSVDRGQTEAASSLGMSPGLTLRRVVLPQAMRVIIPPMGNETISMLKTSSLVAVIAVGELFTKVQIIYSQNLQIIPLLIVACVWYLVMTTVLTVGQHFLEAYFSKGLGDKESEAAEKRAMKRVERQTGVDPGVF
jgi:polar amino acid transport system permease protein